MSRAVGMRLRKAVGVGLAAQSWSAGALVLVLATLLSKLLGAVRDVLVARVFGATAQVDAWVVALAVPSLMGGIGAAVATALVPAYGRVRAGAGLPSAGRLAGGAVVVTLAVAAACSASLLAFPDPWIRTLAPGLPEATHLQAVALVRWLGLLVLGFNMIHVLGAVYHANKHFTTPALLDVLSNLLVIAALMLLAARLGIYSLALGTVAGALLVAAALAARLVPTGLLRFGRGGAELRPVLLMAAPVLAGDVLLQLGVILENALAAGLESGSIAALGYARRLTAVVVSLLAINVARAAYPALAGYAAELRWQPARELLGVLGSQYAFLFLPLSVALVSFRTEVVTAVFARGAFDPRAVNMTAAAFAGYAAALGLAAVVPLCMRVCYALGDALAPLYASAAGLATLALLGRAFVSSYGLVGVPLAADAALLLSTALMAAAAGRRLQGLPWARVGRTAGLALASAVAALLPAQLLGRLLAGWDTLPLLLSLGARLTVYGLTYLALARLCLRPELVTLGRLLRGRA